MLASHLNHYKEAEKILKEVLKIEKNNVSALSALAAVYLKTAKLPQAEVVLEKALNIDTQNTVIRYNLGLVRLYGNSQPYQALRLFHEVMQTSTKFESDLSKLAGSLMEDIKQGNQFIIDDKKW